MMKKRRYSPYPMRFSYLRLQRQLFKFEFAQYSIRAIDAIDGSIAYGLSTCVECAQNRALLHPVI